MKSVVSVQDTEKRDEKKRMDLLMNQYVVCLILSLIC